MTRYDDVMTGARAELRAMIHHRDAAGIAAVRSLIATLDNACAVPVPESAGIGRDDAGEVDMTADVAGAVKFGQADIERRVLSDEEVDHLVTQEIALRRDDAALFDKAKRDREASVASYQVKVLQRLAAGESSGTAGARTRDKGIMSPLL